MLNQLLTWGGAGRRGGSSNERAHSKIHLPEAPDKILLA